MGCINTENLQNCLFCHNLKNLEYCIFNIPVGRQRFEIYDRQYKKILKDSELCFVKDWPSNITQSILPNVDLNLSHHYVLFPETFWNWARTLPNFNE